MPTADGSLTFSPLIGRGAEFRVAFESAQPFPFVVLDDFLVPELAEGLLAEFPSVGEMPKSRDYVFSDKRELSSIEEHGPASRRFHEAMTSPEFAAFLHDLTGWDLFVDPQFHGGGFHQGGDGSFLDTHVDFNIHPLHETWFRMLNLLLYLNPAWAPSYGGDLLLRCRPADEPVAVEPVFNRLVIMLTADNTFHGYRRMELPPGVTRKSVATYAYRMIDGPVPVRTTQWVPENAPWLKQLLARNYNGLVRAKNRVFGSGTAGNRN